MSDTTRPVIGKPTQEEVGNCATLEESLADTKNHPDVFQYEEPTEESKARATEVFAGLGIK